MAAVREHIAHIEAERERLKALAMPPRQVFDSVFADEQAITLGAKFNGLYTASLKQSRNDFDAAP